MLWIKEVEMVASVDDLMSSSSIRRIQMPKFWSTRCEDCLSTEQNHPLFSPQKKNQSGCTKGPEAGPFPSRKTDCLLDLRSIPGHWNPWFCRKLHRPVHYCSSKWWYSEIRFKVGRIFIVNEENPTWWYLGRIVQIKNTRVWETQDRVGIVRLGASSEENRTWLSQIENDGEKNHRAESTN